MRMGGARLLLLLAVLAALSGCARPSSDGPVDPATAAPRQACSVPEMQALEALYAATGGREWRCGAPGRPCSQVQVPTGVTGAAVVGDGQVGLSWPFGLSTSWSDARCEYTPHRTLVSPVFVDSLQAGRLNEKQSGLEKPQLPRLIPPPSAEAA